MEKNLSIGATVLVVIGAAALGYYRYTKLSPEAKKKILDVIKEHGQKFMDNQGPDLMKTIMGSTGVSSAPNRMGEGSSYSS